jgi:hypothetical protein
MAPSKTVNRVVVGAVLWLLIPSLAVVQKFLGIAGVVTYATVPSLIFFAGYKRGFRAFTSRVSEKAVPWLVAATFLGLALIFLVVYPVADAGIPGVGPGSDRDEALNIATTQLLHGHYPYYDRTYLGAPITPMPGALLLALPFILVGNSAYQNLFWLFLFFLFARSFLTDGRLALLLLWTMLTLSPVVLQEFVTGGDLLANGLYVMLFSVWMVSATLRSDLGGWEKLVPAVMLGIGLSSRANFATLLPLIFSALVGVAGWKTAVKYAAVTCATSAAITLPFYLYDPQGFSPLLSSTGQLGRFDSVVPLARVIVPLVTGVISLVLALQCANRDLSIMLRNCAIVLVFPVLCGIVLISAEAAKPEFWFASYGLPAMVFGVTAAWPKLSRTLASTKRESPKYGTYGYSRHRND